MEIYLVGIFIDTNNKQNKKSQRVNLLNRSFVVSAVFINDCWNDIVFPAIGICSGYSRLSMSMTISRMLTGINTTVGMRPNSNRRLFPTPTHTQTGWVGGGFRRLFGGCGALVGFDAPWTRRAECRRRIHTQTHTTHTHARVHTKTLPLPRAPRAPGTARPCA